MILFAKSKDGRLKDIKVIEISNTTRKGYNSNTFCVLLNCNSNQYVIFKHYLEQAIKKYIIGKLEPTQKDVEKYAI